MRCPMKDCIHRFVLTWWPGEKQKNLTVPPFKRLNTALLKKVHDHIGEHLAENT